MTQPPLKSIADARGDPGLAARWAGVLAGLTTLWGAGAALYYAHLGLTLSHYDAKAHLVVARRVIDSLTPGWLQLGAVWLPLPHVLNLFPVQVDALYRTGASGVAISVLSIALLVFCAARLIVLLTGSRVAACVAAAALRPDRGPGQLPGRWPRHGRTRVGAADRGGVEQS